MTRLAYCTNVHAAEDLTGVVAQLDRFAVPIRERLGLDVLGLGLWLAAPIAQELADDPAKTASLRRELMARGLETVTFNGFPYQAFQAPVVKYDVYYPDWTDRRRLDYTLNLAEVLTRLLPDDAGYGSISTLPLAWRTGADSRAFLLDELTQAMRGGRIRVAVEPEPGCLVETTDQAISALSTMDTDYIGLCLDLAHLACAWERPREALAKLAAAGIPVVKTQISVALEVADPVAAIPVLREYAEPRFLHQTRSVAGYAFDDLSEALEQRAPGPWRVHFHAPLHADPLPPLRTTTDVLHEAMACLLAAGECQHFEVETYTWDVLPPQARPTDDAGLVAGIAAELAYARDLLLSTGVS